MAGEGSVKVRARKWKYSSQVIDPGRDKSSATGVGTAIVRMPGPTSLTNKQRFKAREYCRHGVCV
jgi:hypothetical protein